MENLTAFFNLAQRHHLGLLIGIVILVLVAFAVLYWETISKFFSNLVESIYQNIDGGDIDLTSIEDCNYQLIGVRKISDRAVMPAYTWDSSGAFDICAAIPPLNGTTREWLRRADDKHYDDFIPCGESLEVSTGLIFDIPDDHVMLVFSLDNHVKDLSVRLCDGVTVVDSTNKSELRLKFHNDGKRDVGIASGTAIAKGIIIPRPSIKFFEIGK